MSCLFFSQILHPRDSLASHTYIDKQVGRLVFYLCPYTPHGSNIATGPGPAYTIMGSGVTVHSIPLILNRLHNTYHLCSLQSFLSLTQGNIDFGMCFIIRLLLIFIVLTNYSLSAITNYVVLLWPCQGHSNTTYILLLP